MEQIRNSVKIILLNEKKEILLLHTDDKSIKSQDGSYNGGFWQLVGGKMEEGEGILDTAKRELFEETGLGVDDVEFDKVVWQGKLKLEMEGKMTNINQRFILAKTRSDKVVTLENLTKEEKPVIKRLEWFSCEQIKESHDIIYPAVLPNYLEDIINGNIPSEPICIDLG